MKNTTSQSANPTADHVNAVLDRIVGDMQAMQAEPTSIIKAGIQDIEVRALTITAETPVEFIADVRNRISFLKAEASRVKHVLDAVLIERIESTGQDIVLSDDLRLYIGTPPKHEERDRKTLFLAFCDLCGVQVIGGDAAIDALVACFSSTWWSKSQLDTRCEEAGLPQLAASLIKTTWDPVIKEGKPIKQLLESNGFSKPKAKKFARGEFLK